MNIYTRAVNQQMHTGKIR